ncbi:hypothetical protein [Tenggerimyces flavus]|uniref:Uncharacterized protein n=1 Tax=Tenggerimyces flavus TaxID=1708749 RepID=A0ABV7Y2B2_9ACTN|nr:hypothetical protein [Tenggerimyces flavus]MBM7790756.1 hypothetical protein [Tenggerimyces flavus]
MSEDIERGLRGALRRATDGLTDNPGRYDEVARRVRHRRTGTIAGITSAVVLLAAIGGFAWANQGGGDGRNGRTVVANEPKADELDLTCAPPSGGPQEPKATTGKPFVRDGALAARLCPALKDDPQSNVKPDQALLDLRLHANVDQLVATLNKLPAFNPAAFCTMDMGPSYDLLLVYGDGKKVTVSFNAYGCGVAKSGAEFRMDAGKLHEQFSELAKKQDKPNALACQPPSGGVGEAKPTGDGPLVPTGAVVARLCPALDKSDKLYVEPDPADLAPVLRTGVDQLVTKVNGLPAVQPNFACNQDLGPMFDLLLAYPDGSTKVVTFEMRGCQYARSGSEFRQGGPGIAELFRTLVKQQNPAPSGTETCPGPSGGVGTPKNTGTGEFVRPGATTALICGALVNVALDSLIVGKVATTGVDQLVDELNQLTAVNPVGACRDDLGATYDLYLGYPDGSKTVVTFEGFGCGIAKSGEEYRAGARDIDDLFTQLVGDPSVNQGCPPPSGGPKLSTNPGPPGELVEKGAIEARLCPGRAEDTPTDQLASFPIRSGLPGLVDKLNALAVPGKDQVCTDDYGPAYDLVLTYPDGHTRVVKLANYGCGDVESDGRHRVGARAINETFRLLAEDQRLANPPEHASGADCGKPVWATNDQAWPQFLSYESFRPFTDMFVPNFVAEALACRHSTSAAQTRQVPIPKAKAEAFRTLVNDSMDALVECEIAPADPVDVLAFGDAGRGNYLIAIGRGDCAIVQGKYAAGAASPELLAQLDQLLG